MEITPLPPQIAAERLKEVKRMDREVKLKAHKFYANLPTNEVQRAAVEKLAPLVPVIQDWHFQEVMNVTNARNPIYTNLLFYSRRPPTIDKLGTWATIW